MREASLLALKQRIKGDINADSPLVVTSSHIETALNKVKPSVGESERRRYDKMRLKSCFLSDSDDKMPVWWVWNLSLKDAYDEEHPMLS